MTTIAAYQEKADAIRHRLDELKEGL